MFYTQGMSLPSEPEPTEFNTSYHGPGLEVSKDKLSVRYVGEARHSNDIGAIQANRPVPTKRLVYYYEITVLEGIEGRSSVGIGFSHKNFNVTKHPGNETYSYGYLGEDGKKYNQGSKAEDYGLPFGKGDIIGAGVHLARQEVFFTRNGSKLKTAFYGVKAPLFPTISLHCKNECVQVNFGRQPFKFDLEGMVSEEREQQHQQISSVPVAPGVTHQLVRNYLMYYGYGETLAAFDDAAGSTEPSSNLPEAAALQPRQEVRGLLAAGDIDGALASMQKFFPDLLANEQEAQEMLFCLHCQKYLELLRQRHVDAAVEYLQTSLVQCQSNCPHLESTLREVVAVIAYEKPEASPLAHLLSQTHRESVADVVNAAILAHAQGKPLIDPPKSLLESILRQLITAHQALQDENGGQGEILRLEEYLGDSHSCSRMEITKHP